MTKLLHKVMVRNFEVSRNVTICIFVRAGTACNMNQSDYRTAPVLRSRVPISLEPMSAFSVLCLVLWWTYHSKEGWSYQIFYSRTEGAGRGKATRPDHRHFYFHCAPKSEKVANMPPSCYRVHVFNVCVTSC
jgi:hypothetical protein